MQQGAAAGLRKGIAALLVVVLLANWELIPMWVRQSFADPFGVLWSLITAHLLLLVGSIVGLLQGREWGFVYLYLLIPAGTYLLGIAFVPFLPGLFPPALRPAVLLALNAAVLCLTVVAHHRQRTAHRTSPT